MTTFTDRYGLPVTTTSRAAAERYSEAVDLVLSANAGSDDRLADALAADETFALAQIAAARSMHFQGRVPEARAAAGRARELAAAATRRERQHVEAIAAAIDGDPRRAVALTREHLADFPRDAFVLNQANGPFGLIGFGGGADWRIEMFGLLEPLADAYGDDWWFLSALGFAHNELYHFEEARGMAERSLQLFPRSGHGSHTMAHVFFETGDARGGATFLSQWLPDYDRPAQLYGHLWWHRALFALSAGDHESALRIYDEHLRPAVNQGTSIIVLADCAALLWRAPIYAEDNHHLPWGDLRDFAASAFPSAGIAFADTHAAFAYAATRDHESLQRLESQVRERLDRGRVPAGEVVPAIIDAVGMFARGDYNAACDRLEPLTGQVVRVGGSNAQRQVFEDTLLEAYLRAGRSEPARVLLSARLQRRPSPRDERWLARAGAVSTN